MVVERPITMELKELLYSKADEISPLHEDFPDGRKYEETVNPDAINGDAWLENNTPYIWKVGVLCQWDSNKFDYCRVFIGHEREPGNIDFIGMLYWPDGENDDIGRSLQRYLHCIDKIGHPAMLAD